MRGEFPGHSRWRFRIRPWVNERSHRAEEYSQAAARPSRLADVAHRIRAWNRASKRAVNTSPRNGIFFGNSLLPIAAPPHGGVGGSVCIHPAPPPTRPILEAGGG